MVITIEIHKFAITKTLVDQGSLIDILYLKTFKKTRIQENEDSRKEIQSYDDQIVGFSGEWVDTQWYIDLYTTFGEGRFQLHISPWNFHMLWAT